MSIAFASDNLVSLSSLYDTVASSYINNATVSGVLTDYTGATVTTVSLSYVSASNGNYRGTLPASVTATLTIGPIYYLTVSATVSSSVVWVDRQGHYVDYINT